MQEIPSNFLSLIEPLKQIIGYINYNEWDKDIEKIQLKTVQIAQMQCLEHLMKNQLFQKINDENQKQKLFGFINMNIKKIRQLNHSLQQTISNSNSNIDIRTSSRASQRSLIITDKIQYQLQRLYKDTQYSTQILHQMHIGLPDIIKLVEIIGIQQESSKSYTLGTLMKMFSFELNCLKTEIQQHQYEVSPHVHLKVQEIEGDQVMFWLLRTIEHEMKLKTYFNQFTKILDSFLQDEFDLRSLEHMYIVLDDHSQTGSKETFQNSFSERKRSLNSFTDNITPRKFEIHNNSTDYEQKQLSGTQDKEIEDGFYEEQLKPIKDEHEHMTVATQACFNLKCTIF